MEKAPRDILHLDETKLDVIVQALSSNEKNTNFPHFGEITILKEVRNWCVT